MTKGSFRESTEPSITNRFVNKDHSGIVAASWHYGRGADLIQGDRNWYPARTEIKLLILETVLCGGWKNWKLLVVVERGAARRCELLGPWRRSLKFFGSCRHYLSHIVAC